ncbi:MAG: tRNA (guanosine(37)-N1)-methyltransferase TrmD [Candidatus Eisenbacteria bacterium]|nr:tRNA (guanosine(37)-N1)-methyltransferase TrmD [Candidatus Eisenbacteria bacterium]
MKFFVLTVFPKILAPFFDEGVMRIARENGAAEFDVIDIRNFTEDNYRSVDDYPYGGGPGMVMKAEPILKAFSSIAGKDRKVARTIVLSPQGRRFDQTLAGELSKETALILICGRYKGIDERVMSLIPCEEISIGDFVLSGGEIPALALIESIVRLLHGVAGNFESVSSDSFISGFLDAPQYTRPDEVKGLRVPDVLLSGDHEKIRRWLKKESLRKTKDRRPDLLKEEFLSKEEKALLRELEIEKADG